MSAQNIKNDDAAAPQPTPCVAGCGFYGNPHQENMCSKCFKDKHKTSVSQPTPLHSQQNVGTTTSSVSLPSSIAQPTATSPSTATPTITTTETPASPAPPPAPEQANKSRCWTCNKKVGLMGFHCKCNYVFCAEHRHAEAHSCPHDYKTEQRQKLKESNPVIMADKITRI